MKRKTAKEILADSFRELAESKPVDRITVPNIIENCGYSKTTFYRLFKDKYDLMSWDYVQRLQAIIAQTEKKIMSGSRYNWVKGHLSLIEQIGMENYLIEMIGE